MKWIQRAQPMQQYGPAHQLWPTAHPAKSLHAWTPGRRSDHDRSHRSPFSDRRRRLSTMSPSPCAPPSCAPLSLPGPVDEGKNHFVSSHSCSTLRHAPLLHTSLLQLPTMTAVPQATQGPSSSTTTSPSIGVFDHELSHRPP
jgi:hypothetical protein